MKTVQSLEDSGLLIKGFTQTVKNETEEQRGELPGLCLDALVTSLWGNVLTGQGFIWTGDGAASPKRQGTIRAGQDF